MKKRWVLLRLCILTLLGKHKKKAKIVRTSNLFKHFGAGVLASMLAADPSKSY